MIRQFWSDDAGFVISAELVLIATILVIGMIVGLASIRDQMVQELGDVAAAVARVNQSYSFSGVTGHSSLSGGSVFTDQIDHCQGVFSDDPAGEAPMCIEVAIFPTSEGTAL